MGFGWVLSAAVACACAVPFLAGADVCLAAPGQADGKLAFGDTIVAINRRPVAHMTHQAVVAALKVGTVATLNVERPELLSEYMFLVATQVRRQTTHNNKVECVRNTCTFHCAAHGSIQYKTYMIRTVDGQEFAT